MATFWLILRTVCIPEIPFYSKTKELGIPRQVDVRKREERRISSVSVCVRLFIIWALFEIE